MTGPAETNEYATAAEWCDEYLSIVYRRRLGSRHVWCPWWFRHPEAVVRIEAMWRSWEQARVDNAMTGIATWFVEIGDPMMRELLDPDGPFKGCQADRHRFRSDIEFRLPVAPYLLDDDAPSASVHGEDHAGEADGAAG